MTDPGVTLAHVHLWSTHVGSVTWDQTRQLGHFTYSSEFRQSGLEVAPITMPLAQRSFSFPELNTNVFKGLPGFLADSLPDKFGNAVIAAWLARQGRHDHDLTPIERLRLTGTRGMGALEYDPALVTSPDDSAQPLDIGGLVTLINRILAKPGTDPVIADPVVADPVVNSGDSQTLDTLLQVGISADGARAKAVIAWNPTTGEVWPGQRKAPPGCGYWLLKFDGVTGNRDKEADDPQGYGLVEYAYHLMALQAGIHMNECRLLAENGRRHFVTRRFDRTPDGQKIHRQSLCALGHVDFDAAGSYSYEQVMEIIQKLELPPDALKEQFRRMAFNVLARNHDDHPKNIAFLMDTRGVWSLSPAYDLTFAYNPHGQWTNRHQMSLNGKRDNFVYDDLCAVARRFSLEDSQSTAIIQQVANAVTQWPQFAQRAGVDRDTQDSIGKHLRLGIVI